MSKKFDKTRKIWQGGLLLSLLAFLLSAKQVLAAEGNDTNIFEDIAITVLGAIVQVVVWVVGKLLVLVIWLIAQVAQYNDFINAPAVNEGWIIVRDLCNMFFILILLVIAFATILRVQNYSIKQLLKTVVIMALLINFSKMIAGLIIDFAQVIMLTFVNGFKEWGSGGFTAILGIDKLLQLEPSGNEGVDFITIVGSFIFALIYALIALVVMVTMLGVLVIRMVMLWIYIVLSPLAYLLAAFPHGKSYSAIWWKDFSRYVIVGPVLAFFIWLSLATLTPTAIEPSYDSSQRAASNAQFRDTYGFEEMEDSEDFDEIMRLRQENNPRVGITQAGTADHMLRFVVSIGLLIGGLVVTQSIGGATGNAAKWGINKIGKGAGWMKNKGGKAVKWTGKKTWQGGKYATKKSATAAYRGVAKTARGVDQAFLGGKVGTSAAAVKRTFGTRGGYRSMWNKATRAVGWETNKQANDIRQQVAENGVAKVNGVKYVDKGGNIVSKEGDKNPYVYENGRKKELNLKSLSGAALKFRQGKFGSSAMGRTMVEQDERRSEREKKFESAFSVLSKEELWSQYQGMVDSNGNISNVDKFRVLAKKIADAGGPPAGKKVMDDEEISSKAKAAADEKGLAENTTEREEFIAEEKNRMKQEDAQAREMLAERKRFVQSAKEALSDSPKDRDEFYKDINEKNAYLNYDLEDKDDESTMKVEIKKGKIKLSDQDMDHLAMSDFKQYLELFQEALGRERYKSQIKTIDKEGNMALGNKISEASLDIAKDMTRTKQTSSMSAKEKSKLANLRKDYLQFKGDPKKAFTDHQDNFQAAAFGDYVNNASASELSEIDPDDFAKALAEVDIGGQVESKIANNITLEKLKLMQRSGDNPELVNQIAEIMAKKNHVQADQIPYTISNSIKVDISQVEENQAIKQAIAKTDPSKANDYDLINKINEIMKQHAGGTEAARVRYINTSGRQAKPKQQLELDIRNFLNEAANA